MFKTFDEAYYWYASSMSQMLSEKNWKIIYSQIWCFMTQIVTGKLSKENKKEHDMNKIPVNVRYTV